MPLERVELISKMSPKDVRGVLVNNVRRRKFIEFESQWSKIKEHFEGVLGRDRFLIRRTYTRGDIYLICVRGTITQCPGGSRIVLDITLNPTFYIVATLWLGVTSIFFAHYIDPELIPMKVEGIDSIYVPVVQFAFGLFGLYWVYRKNRIQTIHKLEELLDAKWKYD